MGKLKLPKVYEELSGAITHEDDIDDIDVTVSQGVLRRACMFISGAVATQEQLQRQVEQARKTSQLHKDNHLAAEKAIERVERVIWDMENVMEGAHYPKGIAARLKAAIKGESDE